MLRLARKTSASSIRTIAFHFSARLHFVSSPFVFALQFFQSAMPLTKRITKYFRGRNRNDIVSFRPFRHCTFIEVLCQLRRITNGFDNTSKTVSIHSGGCTRWKVQCRLRPSEKRYQNTSTYLKIKGSRDTIAMEPSRKEIESQRQIWRAMNPISTT